MEITGKIIELLPLQEGQGKNGPWKKQEFIIETDGQYPKTVCIAAWGDKVDEFNIQEGVETTVSINVESREYNGKWYTDVKAWKMESSSGVDIPPPEIHSDGPDDDLPF